MLNTTTLRSSYNSKLTIEQKVEALVFEKEGRKFIALGNYALDFKKDFLYFGMTKSGNVKLGDITHYGFNGVIEQVQKCYGKIYDNKIHAQGCQFIEDLN